MLSTSENNITDCPKGVAAELASIAIDNNAIDTIGKATSWRWREGVISRMPKASTIARILTKSFNSEDPHVWYEQVGENLKPFVARTFNVDSERKLESGKTIEDIFDSLVAISIIAGKTRHEDLIYKLCFYKYASSLDDDDETYEMPPAESLIATYSSWAELKLKKIVVKNSYVLTNGYYSYGTVESHEVQIVSEKHARNVSMLSSLRNRVVGFHSHFDMWRNSYYELTDEQHILIERKVIRFSEDIDEYIRDEFISQNIKNPDLLCKKRIYALSAITLPTIGEALEWRN